MDYGRLDHFAEIQHGLITYTQLLESGAGRGWIDHQRRSGRLVDVRRGVYRVAGAPVSQDQAWLGAVLAAGDGAVLSHDTAARAWGLWHAEPTERIDILWTGTSPRLPGVRGHRTKALPTADRSVLRRIPITSVERTLIDSSGGMSVHSVGRRVDDALRRGLTTLTTLTRCARSVPLSGRRPSRAIRAVLAERVPGFDPGGSHAERQLLEVFRRAGIYPLPVQQHRVRVDGRSYKLDYAWPASMHAIEYQGDLHRAASAFHADADRSLRVQKLGWTLWYVTEETPEDQIIAIGRIATA